VVTMVCPGKGKVLLCPATGMWTLGATGGKVPLGLIMPAEN
jgi:hypothetical protein